MNIKVKMLTGVGACIALCSLTLPAYALEIGPSKTITGSVVVANDVSPLTVLWEGVSLPNNSRSTTRVGSMEITGFNTANAALTITPTGTTNGPNHAMFKQTDGTGEVEIYTSSIGRNNGSTVVGVIEGLGYKWTGFSPGDKARFDFKNELELSSFEPGRYTTTYNVEQIIP